MTTPHDSIHEAIRTVAAGVGNPDENRPAAEVALAAAKALGNGSPEDWHGWHALTMGVANLAMILIADREKATGQAPLDTLKEIAGRYPRR